MGEPDLCARCGNLFPKGQVCSRCLYGDDPRIAILLAAYIDQEELIATKELTIAQLRRNQLHVLRDMHEAGLTYRAMATLLGLSKSRMHQLVRDAPPDTGENRS